MSRLFPEDKGSKGVYRPRRYKDTHSIVRNLLQVRKNEYGVYKERNERI